MVRRGVLLTATFEFDYDRADFDDVTDLRAQPRTAPAPRGWNFGDSLVGLHGKQRRIGGDISAFAGVPLHDLRLLQTFTEIG